MGYPRNWEEASPLDVFKPSTYGYEFDPGTAVDTINRIVNPSQAIGRDVAGAVSTLPEIKQPSYADMANMINGRMKLYGIETAPEKQTASPIKGMTLPGAPVQTTGGAAESSALPNQQVVDAIATIQGLKKGYDNLFRAHAAANPMPSVIDTEATLPVKREGIFMNPDGSYTNAPTSPGATFLHQYSGKTPSTGGWTSGDVAERYNRAMASVLGDLATLPNTEPHAANVALAQKTLSALAGLNPLMKPTETVVGPGAVATRTELGGEPKQIADNTGTYLKHAQISADAMLGKQAEVDKRQQLVARQHEANNLYNKYAAELQKIDNEGQMGDSKDTWKRKRAATTQYLTEIGVPGDVAKLPMNEQDFLYEAKAVETSRGKKWSPAVEEQYRNRYNTEVAPMVKNSIQSAYQKFYGRQ